MSLSRRSALKTLAAAGAAVASTAAPAFAREPKKPPADAVGMLYDATLCIGCKACMVACREANGLEPEDPQSRYDSPDSLSGNAKNIIKLYNDGTQSSFMKMQCMHCVDPGCVSACMLGAFKKREHGIVTWDGSKCVGCRYCQIGCPYGVPQFEWDAALPKIVKCELCAHRIAEGGIPACVEVCPRQAVIYGTREELLAEAHGRLEAEPARYEDKVYGEHDGGGTQVLYLAPRGVQFASLGLPDLGTQSVPALPETIQHAVYKGFIAPIALYGVLAVSVWRNRRQPQTDEAAEGGGEA